MQQRRARLDLPPLQSGRVFQGQIDDAGQRVLVEVLAYIPAPSANVAAAAAVPAAAAAAAAPAPAVAVAPAPAAWNSADQGAVDAAAEQVGDDTDDEAVPSDTTAHNSSSEAGLGSGTDGSAIEFSDSDSSAAADAAEMQEPGRAFAAVAAELEDLTCWNDHRNFPMIELSDDKLAATFIINWRRPGMRIWRVAFLFIQLTQFAGEPRPELLGRSVSCFSRRQQSLARLLLCRKACVVGGCISSTGARLLQRRCG